MSVRVIIDSSPNQLRAAVFLAEQEAAAIHRYDRIGFGWVYVQTGHRFFVRSINGGISVCAIKPKITPEARSETSQASAEGVSNVAQATGKPTEPNPEDQ